MSHNIKSVYTDTATDEGWVAECECGWRKTNCPGGSLAAAASIERHRGAMGVEP